MKYYALLESPKVILNLISFQTLKDETSSDGTLMDDGKLDTSFPLMFEKWVNSVKQQDLLPSEQYPQTALGYFLMSYMLVFRFNF